MRYTTAWHAERSPPCLPTTLCGSLPSPCCLLRLVSFPFAPSPLNLVIMLLARSRTRIMPFTPRRTPFDSSLSLSACRQSVFYTTLGGLTCVHTPLRPALSRLYRLASHQFIPAQPFVARTWRKQSLSVLNNFEHDQIRDVAIGPPRRRRTGQHLRYSTNCSIIDNAWSRHLACVE